MFWILWKIYNREKKPSRKEGQPQNAKTKVKFTTKYNEWNRQNETNKWNEIKKEKNSHT